MGVSTLPMSSALIHIAFNAGKDVTICAHGPLLFFHVLAYPIFPQFVPMVENKNGSIYAISCSISMHTLQILLILRCYIHSKITILATANFVVPSQYLQT